MSTPRLQINLDKILHNTSILVARLKTDAISVTGVTKAFLGEPKIAQAMLRAGVTSLGDSRIENIEIMRQSGIAAQMMLIRSPMLSQAERVVASADISFNTELKVLAALSTAALKAGKIHGVLLMVELGDLREGIMPQDVERTAQAVHRLPNIRFMGLGANLACRNGVSPDDSNMAVLSKLAANIAHRDESHAQIVSGGNSSCLDWVFAGGKTCHITNLRLGEAILLGTEALNRKPIEGLFTDAIRLSAEVIECKTKPSKPWGTVAQSAFGRAPSLKIHGDVEQVIVAIGRQDVDPEGLYPAPGIQILDASSDHLILNTGSKKLAVGSEVSFKLNYSALLRAMTSPHTCKTFIEHKLTDLQPQVHSCSYR